MIPRRRLNLVAAVRASSGWTSFAVSCFPSFRSSPQIRGYVQVYMKWKKDSYYDSIDAIHKSLLLKPIVALKNFMISSSSTPEDNYSVPISAVSKKGSEFGINIKVARFLRSYPSFFEEFKGPLYDLPWFRLTQNAIDLDKEERLVYQESRNDILGRLAKLILMSSGSGKALPLKIIKGLQWQLGLPDEFLTNPPDYIEGYGSLKLVDLENGIKGFAVERHEGDDHKVLSVLQRNAMKRGEYSGHKNEAIAFPMFPSKGLRLKQKIKDWLHEFQKLPYVSPYDDFPDLNPDSDASEKRVVGLLHELLCLFVEHSVERKYVISLRKYLGLPQKVHKAFERHPYAFYLSLKNSTVTAILKEAYACDEVAIDPHPLATVRKKYVDLMKESGDILRRRRLTGSRASASDYQRKEDDSRPLQVVL